MEKMKGARSLDRFRLFSLESAEARRAHERASRP